MSIPSPVRKSLEKLPRRSAPWLIGMASKPDGSCGCYVLDRDGDARAVLDLPAAPDGAAWGKLLVAAMQRPQPLHEPGLPRRLICDDGKIAAVIAPIVSPLGIAVETAASQHLAAAEARVAESSAPSLSSLPDALRRLYADAASLAEIAPWDWFDEQPEFAIATADSNAPVAVAVLMGGLGSSFGFALFRSAADLQRDIEMSRPRVARVPHTVLELGRAVRAPSAMVTRSAERGYTIYAADRYPLALRVGDLGMQGWDATAIPGLALAASAILRWCQVAREGQPFARAAGAAVLLNTSSFSGIPDPSFEDSDEGEPFHEGDLVVPCDVVWEHTAPDQPPTLRLPVARDSLATLLKAIGKGLEADVTWSDRDASGLLNLAEGIPHAGIIGVEFTTLPDAAWLRAAALADETALVVLSDRDAAAESASPDAIVAPESILVDVYGLRELRRKLGLPQGN